MPFGYTEENESIAHRSRDGIPNGSVLWRRKLSLTITCDFDYGNLPSGAHDCDTVAHIMNLSTAVLQHTNRRIEVEYMTV